MVYQNSNKKCDTYGILRLFQENKAIKGLSFFTKYLHLHKFLAGDSLLRRAAREVYSSWMAPLHTLLHGRCNINLHKESFVSHTKCSRELLSLTGQKPWGMCVGVPLSIPAKIKSNKDVCSQFDEPSHLLPSTHVVRGSSLIWFLRIQVVTMMRSLNSRKRNMYLESVVFIHI